MSSTRAARPVGTRGDHCRRVTPSDVPELPYPVRALQIAPRDREHKAAAERVKQVREGARAGNPAECRHLPDWRSRGYDD